MKEFKTFAGMARHFARLATFGPEVVDAIAEKAGETIQGNAKAKLGHYQAASGPFAGWAPLSAATQIERQELGFAPNDPLLRSGQLRDAIEMSVVHDGVVVGVKPGPHVEPDGRVEDVGEIAISMELGGRAPPRPFLGPAAFEAKPKVGRLAGVAVIAWISGRNWLKPPQSIKFP